jgi:hypothetical protein
MNGLISTLRLSLGAFRTAQPGYPRITINGMPPRQPRSPATHARPALTAPAQVLQENQLGSFTSPMWQTRRSTRWESFVWIVLGAVSFLLLALSFLL